MKVQDKYVFGFTIAQYEAQCLRLSLWRKQDCVISGFINFGIYSRATDSTKGVLCLHQATNEESNAGSHPSRAGGLPQWSYSRYRWTLVFVNQASCLLLLSLPIFLIPLHDAFDFPTWCTHRIITRTRDSAAPSPLETDSDLSKLTAEELHALVETKPISHYGPLLCHTCVTQ